MLAVDERRIEGLSAQEVDLQLIVLCELWYERLQQYLVRGRPARDRQGVAGMVIVDDHDEGLSIMATASMRARARTRARVSRVVDRRQSRRYGGTP